MPMQVPNIQLLLATVATLEAIDWAGVSGVPDLAALKVRHARNRPPPTVDKPSLSVVWEGSDPQSESNLTDDELGESMDILLVVDVALPSEDSLNDPTGWYLPSVIAAIAIDALRDDNSPVGLLSSWRSKGSTTPDHDASGPDNGRLEQTVTVVYRVLETKPSTLLAQGVDG